MPDRRLRRRDRDAVERLGDAEQALRARRPRGSTASLPGRRTHSASRAASRRRRRRPRPRARRCRARVCAKSRSSATSFSANGRARRARSSRNASTCCGDSRHLRHERHFGVVRVAEELRELAAQLDDARDERRVVPFGLAELGGARGAFAVERLAQRAVVGVLHHRQVGRHVQRELPARRLPSFCGRLARRLQHVVAGCRAMRSRRRRLCENALVASSTFSENLRRQLRELLLDLGEALPSSPAAARRRRGGSRAARSRRSSCAPATGRRTPAKRRAPCTSRTAAGSGRARSSTA